MKYMYIYDNISLNPSNNEDRSRQICRKNQKEILWVIIVFS